MRASAFCSPSLFVLSTDGSHYTSVARSSCSSYAPCSCSWFTLYLMQYRIALEQAKACSVGAKNSQGGEMCDVSSGGADPQPAIYYPNFLKFLRPDWEPSGDGPKPQ